MLEIQAISNFQLPRHSVYGKESLRIIERLAINATVFYVARGRNPESTLDREAKPARKRQLTCLLAHCSRVPSPRDTTKYRARRHCDSHYS